jgi:hypothetical protein
MFIQLFNRSKETIARITSNISHGQIYLRSFSIRVLVVIKRNQTNDARLEDLTAVGMKMAVFWVVMCVDRYEFTDVSEVCTASIIRAIAATAIFREMILTCMDGVHRYLIRICFVHRCVASKCRLKYKINSLSVQLLVRQTRQVRRDFDDVIVTDVKKREGPCHYGTGPLTGPVSIP